MNLPPQPPLSEEPEQQPIEEETLVQHPTPGDTAKGLPSTEEETLAQPSIPDDAKKDEKGSPSIEDAPTQVSSVADISPEDDIPTQQGLSLTQDNPSTWSETNTSQESETSFIEENVVQNEEDEGLDEDEDLEPVKTGVFIRKEILIAAASAILLIALIAVLFLVISRPKDPPTDWIASYTPAAGTSTTGKILYYLHWTDDNSELKGQLQLAANSNGTPQTLTAPATGVYDKDNHIIYIVFIINGGPATLTGKVNDNNDTLTLNQVGATTQEGLLTFHTGSAADYKKATDALGKNATKK